MQCAYVCNWCAVAHPLVACTFAFGLIFAMQTLLALKKMNNFAKHIIKVFPMKTVFRYALALMCAICAPCGAGVCAQSAGGWSYSLPSEVCHALQSGDIVKLAGFLNNTVEVTVPDGSGIYSRKQAEMVLAGFFANVRQQAYAIDHEKSVGDSTLSIGSLTADNVVYRIYILTQMFNGECLIHQLRIEVQND